ncbi:MAG: DUF3164 family protein [Prolixibacteraceae bacterium]|nr:DUF3164 family protein [Prolixibacteraceae bacterium]
METIDITTLTPEQRKNIFAQVEAEQKREEEQKQADRDTYKEIINELVDEAIVKIQKVSKELTEIKTEIFSSFEKALDFKRDLFGVKSKQRSFTFSNKEKNARITLGFRTISRYDDTANEGVAIVREYIDSLSSDGNSRKQARLINSLLKRNKQGDLKPDRVLDLYNEAKLIGDKRLIEGVEIIMQAYSPEGSAYYVEAEVKNGVGAWVAVPLNVTAAKFPDDYQVKF